MTINEPNHYARNLKFVSTLFILYWVLGLEPTSDEIRLAFINYKITNVNMLGWIAHIILFYVLWAFLVSNKHDFSRDFKIHFSNKWTNKNIKINKIKHLNKANNDYIANWKESYEAKYLKKVEQNSDGGIGPYRIELISFASGLNNNKPVTTKPYIRYIVSYPSMSKGGHSERLRGFVNISKLSWHYLMFTILIPFYYFKFSLTNSHFQDTVLPLIMFVLALLSSLLNLQSIQFPFD